MDTFFVEPADDSERQRLMEFLVSFKGQVTVLNEDDVEDYALLKAMEEAKGSPIVPLEDVFRRLRS